MIFYIRKKKENIDSLRVDSQFYSHLKTL